MISDGGFREDLFHRLDLLRIKIPPLASRGKDVGGLAQHLLVSLAAKYKLPTPQLDPQSKHALMTRSWTGNTRELIHELERGLILAEPGEKIRLGISKSDSFRQQSDDWLNQDFVFPQTGFDLEAEIVRLIQMAISQADGNVSEAARVLGVPRDYLRYRLKKTQG